MLTKHYVYRTDDSKGHFYIGVRSCSCNPEDDQYIGSGSWVKRKKRLCTLVKTVIAVFETRESAELFEVSLITSSKQLSAKCMNERIQRYNSGASSKTRNNNRVR